MTNKYLPPGVAGERLLNRMGRNLGKHEEPMGSNRGPYVERMQHHTWLPGSGWPWCVAEEIGGWEETYHLQHPYPTASVGQKAEWARRQGLTVPLSGAKRGDAVCLGTRHITRIVSLNHGAGTFVGRGGNQGDTLKDSVYRISDIATVISADKEARYLGITQDGDPNKPPPKKHRPPIREVVTGDGEHSVIVYRGRKKDKILGAVERALRKGVRKIVIRPPKKLELNPNESVE